MENGSPFLTYATTVATFRCMAAECDGNFSVKILFYHVAMYLSWAVRSLHGFCR